LIPTPFYNELKMKRIFPIALSVMILLLTGCHKDLWNDINDLKSRVKTLEEKCNTMNTNIDALQVIINAQSSGDMISNVSEITYGSASVGYTITFTSGKTITIYNGKNGVDGKDGQDGTNGQDGYTPSIGVAKDADGIYYWTLDGSWLLDSEGNKLPVTGAKGDSGADGKDGEYGQNGTNGTTPMFKIDNGYWYVSYDNGSTWALLGQATGDTGKDGSIGADGKDGVTPLFKIMEGNWYVSYDDGATWNPAGQATGDKGETGATGATGAAGITPHLKIEDGFWYVSLDNGANWTKLGKATGENGKDGKDGQDGADGQDGVTPQLKIEDGYWFVSYDNGTNWTKLGKATGENGKDGTNGTNGTDGAKGDKGDKGDSMFSSVTQDNEYVYFTLADGTVIKIAKGDGDSALSVETKFAIKYDANGGTGTMANDSVWRMKTATVKACDFLYAKHIFTGWNTKEDGTGVPFACGETIVMLQNVTLYAQWNSCAFSTSEIKKVLFAPGNLQYQASTQTWRFAEHQYDYIGAANGNISNTYTGWIDLFGWGTGNSPTKKSIDPFEYLTYTSWGVNKIGSYPANSWYNMSKEQWFYLFNTRTNASSLYGFATINGINGIIILPDIWKSPNEITFKSGKADYTNNVYTIAQWQQMESAGAVFLPAAGKRSGTTISDYGSSGNYWSRTAESSGSSSYLQTFSNNYSALIYSSQTYGFSVRLVQNVQ